MRATSRASVRTTHGRCQTTLESRKVKGMAQSGSSRPAIRPKWHKPQRPPGQEKPQGAPPTTNRSAMCSQNPLFPEGRQFQACRTSILLAIARNHDERRHCELSPVILALNTAKNTYQHRKVPDSQAAERNHSRRQPASSPGPKDKPQRATARITFNPNPDSHVIFPTPCVFNNILGSLSLAPGPSSHSTTPGAPAAPPSVARAASPPGSGG